MELSEKILKLRKQAGLSQEDLAEQLDESRQAISRWEAGSAMPDAANILQLSKLFGVTADYLLNDDCESDRDVPVIQDHYRQVVKKGAALMVALLGLLANALIYILSRFMKVFVPRITYEDGVKWFTWDGTTGYSYRYFVEEHELEAIVVFAWILFFGGMIFLFAHSERGKKLAAKWKKWKTERRRKKKSEQSA